MGMEEAAEILREHKERQARAKGGERIYHVTPGNQRGELEYQADPEQLAKRRAAREKTAKAVARAIEGQAEHVAENYQGLQDHLEEIASGALITTEDGPEYLEFEQPEVPEAERLRAAIDRSHDPVERLRLKRRLAAVKETEARDLAQARELEMAHALRMPDAVSDAESREAIDEEIAEDVWEVMDTDGQVYEFDDEDEANDFAEDVQAQREAEAEEDDDEWSLAH